MIRQILLSLNYMHKKRIVHRDIKPENVMISEELEGDKITCKLIDFGFACFFDKEEGMKTVLGTPYYMAPEIINK